MKKISAVVVGVCLSSSLAFAEQSNFNRSRVSHSWSSSQLSTGHDVKSSVGQNYRGILSLQFDYVTNPYKLIDQDGRVLTDVVSDFSRVRLGYGAHLNRTWFVGVSIPFDNVKSKPFQNGQQHPDILEDPFSQSFSGIGDIELLVKRRLEALSLRWNWALEFLATLPTGDEDSFNIDGDYSLALRLAFSHYIGRENQAQTYGYIGGRYAPGSRLDIDPLYSPFEAEKRLEFGIGIRNQFTQSVGGFADLGGFLAFPFESGQNPVELSLGFDSTLGRSKIWKVYAGLGLEGLAGEEFSNDERYFLGLKRLVGKLSDNQVAEFKKTKYPVYSSSYDILLGSLHSETSVVKKIIGKSHSVYFNSGGAKLSPQSELGIIDVVSHLIKYSDKIVEVNIEGFADSDGNVQKNLVLSKKRAEAVRDVLTSYGVKAEKLKVVFQGESRSGREADAFGKLNNRRAEIYVSELDINNFSFPELDSFSMNRKVAKVANKDEVSQSYTRNKLFPKPFVLNGRFIEAFTILTQDNLTWGDVSTKLYGSSKFKKVLRALNYNRKPSLGDVVYFPTSRKVASKKVERFSFVRWR